MVKRVIYGKIGKALKGEAACLGMGTLLIVDDDKNLLKVLQQVLEESGHGVSIASNGEEALRELSARDFDLAIVDLKLEEVSGFDLIDTIKEMYPDVVVIISTGFASLDSAIKALRMGAYDFLQKPLKPALLIKAVERGLEKKQLKDLAEAVIRKMDEGIALLDSEGLIDFVSGRFCEISQYSADELTGGLLLSLVAPEFENLTAENLKKAWEGSSRRFQASMIRKDGKELTAIISLTKVGNRVLAVVSDITKITGAPVIKRELIYKIQPGSVYLITEESADKAMEALTDLLQAGYGGLMVTRDHPDEIKSTWNTDATLLWLTDDVAGESTMFPNIALLERKLQSYLSRNRVILIDRLDYLVSKNSFESVLGLVQRLNDLAFTKKSIILLSVDPRTLTEREFSLLEKETRPLVPINNVELPEDLSELLQYVARRNEVGGKPSHKEIEKRFDVTRTTVRKRLIQLEEKGMIVERKKGRMKVVEITEKGRKALG